MNNNNMITIRNKNTGEVKTVPRHQFVDSSSDNSGLTGIGNDVLSSLNSAPGALGDMLSSIIPGAKNVANYATSNNPVSTLGNMGAGMAEGGAALLSSPQLLMRYLAEKFPEFGKKMEQSNAGGGSFKDPTFYEKLKQFENNHGLAPQSDEEASVRNLGGLLGGGKALTKIPSMLGRTAAVTGQSAGQGGDPVHAAILSMIGERTAKSAARGINKIANDSTAPLAETNQSPISEPAAHAPSPASPTLTANIANISGKPNEYMTAISNIPTVASKFAQAIPKAVKAIPEATSKAVKAIPETAAKVTASALETAADLGTKAKIPGLQPTMGALGAYLKYLAVPPEEMAERKLFGDIKPKDLPRIMDRVEAGKRAGIHITPAEASLRPVEGAKQGTIGRTTPGLDVLDEEGRKRTQSEGQAINNFLDSIHNEHDLSAEKNSAYQETMSGVVPPEFIQKHSAKPVVQDAINHIKNDSAYRQILERELGVKLKNVQPNSFRYWDIIKRSLGETEESKKDKFGRATPTSSEIGRTRREMVKEMTDIKPEYETARAISERKFTRQKVEDFFDKRSMTGNNLHKYLSSSRNYNNLVHKLRALPDAKQRLDDLHKLGGDLIPNDINIRSAAALKRTGMSSPRNKLDAAKADLDERFGQAHDVAAVKLMMNPEWPSKLAEYLKKKGSK